MVNSPEEVRVFTIPDRSGSDFEETNFEEMKGIVVRQRRKIEERNDTTVEASVSFLTTQVQTAVMILEAKGMRLIKG